MTQPIGPGEANSIAERMAALMDASFAQTVTPALRAAASEMQSPEVTGRLDQLRAEAERLEAAGEPLQPDNPVLLAVLVALGAAARLDGAADAVQNAGVLAGVDMTRQLALPGMSDAMLIRVGIGWNTPDAQAVAQLVRYTNSAAWADELRRFGDVPIEAIRRAALRGVVEGWNPTRTAREIARLAQDVSRAQAATLMRTLQLTSYRDAAAMTQRANLDILRGQIRIGTLDGRICLACIALHGTLLPAGERVDDHHNGRCVGVPLVRGWRYEITTGEAWFRGLDEDAQRAIMGPGAFELWQRGRADLRDFAQAYTDSTFGRMIGRATLAEAAANHARNSPGGG